MTLIYKHDLAILKMQPHTENQASVGQNFQMSESTTDAETDATERITRRRAEFENTGVRILRFFSDFRKQDFYVLLKWRIKKS